MKKTVLINVILLVFALSSGFAQEQWATHTRGLLHQSVFNTGALGVQYNSFRSAYSGDSLRTAFEWPGNSYFRLNNYDYWYYNENGAGLVLVCDTGRTTNKSRGQFIFIDSVGNATTKGIDMVGCLGLGGGGTYRDGTGLHYWPGTATKTTNYPLGSDGNWNPNYNPNEAEELITSSVYTPYGIKITRTSRAWSYPGYDSFIIYDYTIKNTGEHFKWNTNAPSYISPTHSKDTLSDLCIDWLYSFFPSYVYGNQIVSDWTTEASKALAHIDLTRYLQYVVSPDGRPYQTNFDNYSQNGTYGGGLSAPASVGYMCLYYDYNKLMPNTYSHFTSTLSATNRDSLVVYDPNGKFKQPWVWASTQANLSSTKILTHVNGISRYAPWNPNNPTNANDAFLTTHMGAARAAYWYGRARPNANFNFASPMVHSMSYGPYQLAPDDSFHVVIAEVAGFGPGRKWDAKYYDCGGGNETVVTSDFMHPVASWDSVITYTNSPAATASSSTGGIGINYTGIYGYPAYIRDTNVVSMRDVADRCIQLYTGNTSVVKWDTSQYEPSGGWVPTGFTPAPSPTAVASRAGGWNAAFRNSVTAPLKMPYPNPITEASSVSLFIPGTFVKDSLKIAVKIGWNGAIENIPANVKPYVNGLKNFEILKSTSPLGPWVTFASVNLKDSQYWNEAIGKYQGYDYNVKLGGVYYYAVVSVDSSGKKNGVLTMAKVTATLAAYETVNKVYAVPNPYFLTSGLPGAQIGSQQIYFYGLTNKATIRIFSFSGQLIKTLNHVGNSQSEPWDLRTESLKKVASGVYYFTVEDSNTGKKAWNKFIVVH